MGTQKKPLGARLKARRVKISKWWKSAPIKNFRQRYGAALIVFGVAAYVSYGHIHTLTLRAGESQTVAMLMPVQVDALMFVGALYVDHAKTAMGKTFAWASFVVGFLASFAANYLATAPTILGKGAGIMTALALLFAAGTVHWGNKKAKPKPRAKVSPAVRKASEPRPAFVGELDTDVLAVAYR